MGLVILGGDARRSRSGHGPESMGNRMVKQGGSKVLGMEWYFLFYEARLFAEWDHCSCSTFHRSTMDLVGGLR